MSNIGFGVLTGRDYPLTALGVMTKSLSLKSLWPMPSAEDVSLSMLELSNIVEEIRMQIESKVVLRISMSKGDIDAWS
jgi:hypothetical protein